MTQRGLKRLTLVRHAKSDWQVGSLADFDRPLNARGERDAPDMAGRAAAAHLKPTLVISSPAVRALATARIFAATCGDPARRIRPAEDAYLASSATLLEVVRRLGGRAAHVMFFGHNPGLSEFAARLTGDARLGEMPTCAVTSLLVPLRHWSELGPGSAQIDFRDFPKSGR